MIAIRTSGRFASAQQQAYLFVTLPAGGAIPVDEAALPDEVGVRDAVNCSMVKRLVNGR